VCPIACCGFVLFRAMCFSMDESLEGSIEFVQPEWKFDLADNL